MAPTHTPIYDEELTRIIGTPRHSTALLRITVAIAWIRSLYIHDSLQQSIACVTLERSRLTKRQLQIC